MIYQNIDSDNPNFERFTKIHVIRSAVNDDNPDRAKGCKLFGNFLQWYNSENSAESVYGNVNKLDIFSSHTIPAGKVLLFFETCFFCATSSTESSGEIRTTSCYCLCLFSCCSSATVVLLCAVVLAALQATFVLL